MPSRPVCNLYMLSSMMIGPKHAYRILRQDLSMVEIQNQTKVWKKLRASCALWKSEKKYPGAASVQITSTSGTKP